MQAAADLYALAAVHQIPAAAVDAGDVAAITEAMLDGAAAVRGGGGPRFIEARTPPWAGNATFIPSLATGELELAEAATAPADGWAQVDPVLREARSLLAEGVALAALVSLDAEVSAAAKAAFERAAAAPLAPSSAAFEHVWA
jgi:pyruvate dehydrogenase E1 component alpha subunit